MFAPDENLVEKRAGIRAEEKRRRFLIKAESRRIFTEMNLQEDFCRCVSPNPCKSVFVRGS